MYILYVTFFQKVLRKGKGEKMKIVVKQNYRKKGMQ